MPDEKDEAGERVSSEPATQSKRRVPAWVRHWVVAFLVINAASFVIDHLLDKESRERLRHADADFVRSVDTIAPFQLVTTYWNFVWYDILPEGAVEKPSGLEAEFAVKPAVKPEPKTLEEKADALGEKVGGIVGRVLFGWFYVIVLACMAGGTAGIIVNVLAVGLAYLIISGGDRELTVFDLVLLPFIGSILVLVLIFVMRAGGMLFSGLLDVAQILAAINATAFGLFWKVGEHHATDSLIKRLSGKHKTAS